MIGTVQFFPWILVILDQVLWAVLCVLTVRIQIVKVPSMLVLCSSALGLLISIQVLLLKIQKAFGIPIFPKGESWTVLTMMNRHIDFLSRALILAAALWVIVLFIRHKENSHRV